MLRYNTRTSERILPLVRILASAQKKNVGHKEGTLVRFLLLFDAVPHRAGIYRNFPISLFAIPKQGNYGGN